MACLSRCVSPLAFKYQNKCNSRKSRVVLSERLEVTDNFKKYHRVLTIAGSDSGGGAGIQADLKTISANHCYGMSVITALTAQNTMGVTAIHPVPVDFVGKQLEAVLSDIGADAIKIGIFSPNLGYCINLKAFSKPEFGDFTKVLL